MRRAWLASGAAVFLSACSIVAPHSATSTHRSTETGQATGTGCGIERWAVKTATDSGASQISLTPRSTTVQRLGEIPAPRDPTKRVFPTEDTNFRVTATITGIKEEADSDYHLVLSDAAGRTMIAEAPQPSCAAGSRLLPQIRNVREALDRACAPVPTDEFAHVSIPAVLTGVGFFDFPHHQTGVSPNAIELHPLTAVTLNGRC